jgi:succinate dehydrogenase/fumarate reductase flavoprotein subunit
MGESVGGYIRRDLTEAAALAPVSLVPQRGVWGKAHPNAHSHAYFPHLLERGKPGLIAVTPKGVRFTNEANSYYDFMRDLLAAMPASADPNAPIPHAWLICDHRFIRRYGLGAVKPAPMPLWGMLCNGYLKRSNSIAALAKICGIDAEALQQTIQDYNWQASHGRDVSFAKGETPYNRIQGDNTPIRVNGRQERQQAGVTVQEFVPEFANPCMAPILQAPYYAVRVVAGSLGTFAGLATNEHAQVLDQSQCPIAGLYAAGNDMSSMMGGRYPSGGITLGPAMTFGYIAAHHAAQTIR